MSTVIATVTNIGRMRLSDLQINGRGFIINKYVLGDGGHDPSDPTRVLTPDLNVMTLPNLRYGPVDINESEIVGLYCPQFNIIVPPTEALGPISNLGLMGTINYIPSGIPSDPVVGTTFLFAIANLPYHVKSSVETMVVDIAIQF